MRTLVPKANRQNCCSSPSFVASSMRLRTSPCHDGVSRRPFFLCLAMRMSQGMDVTLGPGSGFNHLSPRGPGLFEKRIRRSCRKPALSATTIQRKNSGIVSGLSRRLVARGRQWPGCQLAESVAVCSWKPFITTMWTFRCHPTPSPGARH